MELCSKLYFGKVSIWQDTWTWTSYLKLIFSWFLTSNALLNTKMVTRKSQDFRSWCWGIFFRSGFLELFVFFLNVYNCQLLRTESFTFFYFVVCKILPKTLKTLGGFAALPARSKKLKLTKSSLFVVSNRLVKTEFSI